MKKLLLAALILIWSGSIWANSFASSCRYVDFDNGNVCVNIQKVSGKTFKLTTDVNNGSSTLRCGILLEDKPYKDVNCNGGTFSVNNLDTQLIKIFVKQGTEVPSNWDSKPNSDSKWLFPQWYYDFGNEEWRDWNNSNSSSSSSSDSSSYTLDNYDGSNAKITVAYRTSSYNSWQTTSASSYFTIDDNTPNFSNGSASTYIRFKKNIEYRITVTDTDSDIYTQKTVYVGSSSSSSSSSSDISKFSISLSDSTPSTNSDVKLTLKAQDSSNYTLSDYDGSNAKIAIAYRTSSSSSWRTTSASSYFTIDDSTPNFSNGSASTYIRFKRNYDYRITVTDTDSDIYTQKTVYVGSSSSSSSSSDISKFSITLDDSTPSTNSDVRVTLKAQDSSSYTLSDYDGSNAKITIAYRTSSYNSWQTTSASSYFTIDDNTPNFSNGSASTYIRFKRNIEYRITVTDTDTNTESQKIVKVGSSSSSNSSSSNTDIDNFYISVSDSYPNTNQEISLDIRARDYSNYTISDYDGSNAKITVAYRTSSYNSWQTTSYSSYFTIDDNTPNFSNGSASTYITLKQNYEYRITVTDLETNTSSEKIIDVGSSSSNNYYGSNGFSSDEISTIRGIYNSWDSSMNAITNSSYNLRNNTTRQTMSKNLKNEMYKIINNNTSIYDNYSQFEDGFNNRHSYTQNNK